MLGSPWAVKLPAAIAAVAHSIVFRPRRTPRLVFHAGRVDVPEQGLVDLVLGRHTRHCGLWIRFDLRGADRALDILLLADQVDPTLWRMLRAELARPAPDGARSANPRNRDLR